MLNAQDIRIRQAEMAQQARVDLYGMDADHIAPKAEFLTQGAPVFRNSSMQRVDVQTIRNDEMELARDEQGNVISFHNIPDTPYYVWNEAMTRERQEEDELYLRIAAGKLNPAPDFSAVEHKADIAGPIVVQFSEGDTVTHRQYGTTKVDSVFDNGFVYLVRQSDGVDPYVHQSDLTEAQNAV